MNNEEQQAVYEVRKEFKLTHAAWTDKDIHALLTMSCRLAREEMASMAGLVMKRMQEATAVQPMEADKPIYASQLQEIFGEVLRDFGGTTSEPGRKAEIGGATDQESSDAYGESRKTQGSRVEGHESGAT